MKKYILLGVAAMALTSCSDFLEREPLDFGSSESYYKTENDLRIAANDFYENLPANGTGSSNTGLYADDKESDNLCGPSAQSLLFYGNKFMPNLNESQWQFGNFRGINFFLEKVAENEGHIAGSAAYINHYIGEAYFFRAFEHYRLLRYFGDAPILTAYLPDDNAVLTEASRRHPRNEVARFILEDLDRAADLLLEMAPEKGRVTKAAAYALKSRVALHEATFERYHANTCFVPGNAKWVGAKMYPNFTFPAGSPEAEVNWFLDQAIDASQKAVGSITLHNDYLALFNSVDLSSMPEVLLARYYMENIFAHNCSYYLKGGGGLGVTRQAVNTYLMKNGLPIYAPNSGYHGDINSFEELMDRDPRIAGKRDANGYYPVNSGEEGTTQNNRKYTGYGIIRAAGQIKDDAGNELFYYRPNLTATGQDRSTTGYELNKWVNADPAQQIQNQTTTAVPIFRAAECMLNYIEAYYERYGSLGGQCDAYWRAIRNRAGLDPDYNKTIANTDMSKECVTDFGAYSHGKVVSPTLYNIRRERRCELMAEGRRLDDLKRWRSLDNMVAWQPEGFNLWEQVKDLYGESALTQGISSSSLSTYLRPLQAYESGQAYGGYTFPKPHYLEPIPTSDFLLTIDPATGTSTIYQNPGWPTSGAGLCDLAFDCD